MNNFTLQQLQIIEKVVAEGSMTKAASRLFLTQPALSHQIKDLESRIGLKLFDRVGKKLVPTEVCRAIVVTAQSVLPQIDELSLQLKNFKQGKNRTIRLSTECYTCYHWLPKIIRQFQRGNSAVEIKIVIEATAQPLDFLERGELDVAIVGKLPANKNLFATTLFEDEMVAVLPKNHRLSEKNEPLEPSDFADENFIYYNVPDKGNQILDGYFAANKPRRIQKVQLTEAIIEMIAAEMGVGIMATWAVKPYLTRRDIATARLDGEHSRKSWFAVARSNEDKTLNQFVNAVKKRF